MTDLRQEPILVKFPAPKPVISHALRLTAVFASAIMATSCLTASKDPAQASNTSSDHRAASAPNIIFVNSDDLGWADVGFHGSEIRTPTLDRLAHEGVQLDRYYTYAVCSPSRAALMSGRSSLETGVDAPVALDAQLPMDTPLLPEHLRNAGYQTMMVGKWHLGQADVAWMPFKRGFDTFYGFLGGFIDHYHHLTPGGQLDWQRDGVSVREEGYTTDLMTTEAIKRIKLRDKARPFFLYLAYDAPHSPLQAPEADIKAYENIPDMRRRIYAAMVTHFDTKLAEVVKTVEDEGLTANTIIVWVSDNGGQVGAGSLNLPLRGGKGTTFEGGQRVAAVAYWPGHFQGGQKIVSPVTVLDWFPTLLASAGIPVPTDARIVGRDVRPILEGRKTETNKMVMGNHNQGEGYYESAFDWPWKLMRVPTSAYAQMTAGTRFPPETVLPKGINGETSLQLFDVVKDPGETTDLSGKYPDIVARLTAQLNQAPRAKISLSQWAPERRRMLAAAAEKDRPDGGGAAGGPPTGNGPPNDGPPRNGPPRDGPPRNGPPGGGQGPQGNTASEGDLPGGSAFTEYAVEKGKPVAESARGAVVPPH